jgi:5-methylcytosine-specific restriction endonuclease McrA
MLLLQEPLSGQGLIEATFRPEDVPDARLYRRLKTTADGILRAMMNEGDERPQDAKRAERRGARRLYVNVRVDADLLCQHAQQRCIEAIKSLPRVLVAHDTVEFDLHGRHEPADAGPLRSSQARGYLLHHGVVLDPSNDARVGIVYMQAWTRPFPEGKQPEGKRRVRREWDNEDDKWGWGVEQTHTALTREGFHGHVRHLVDNEGSSYASLVRAKRRRRDYVARTKVDRNIAEGSGKLFEYLLDQPVVQRWTIAVEEDPKSIARGTSRRRRQAEVEVRFASVTLQPTCNYTGRRYREGLQVAAVYVYEPEPPAGSEPLSWMLLSVQPIASQADAEEVVLDYKNRWGVEDINKVLKSGCHADLAVVPNLEAFRRLLAVAWPIATHIARWTYAARVRPLEPAAPHLGDEAIEVLKLACRYHHLPLPRRPWTLRDMTLRLAQMGGYEPRKDQPPGWKVIWRGWRVFNNFWDHLRFIRSQEAELPQRRRHAGGASPVGSGPVLRPAGSPADPG